jgi:hypothetical protein
MSIFTYTPAMAFLKEIRGQSIMMLMEQASPGDDEKKMPTDYTDYSDFFYFF